MTRQEILGETLRNHRKRKGLSQQQVADKLGVGKATICHWEKGKRNIFALQLIDWCSVVGISPAEIMKEIRYKTL